MATSNNWKMRPLSPGNSWFMVIFPSLMILLALANLIFNPGGAWGWSLVLLIFMSWSLYYGIWSLRHQHLR